VRRYAAAARERLGCRLWYSLSFSNYRVADAARAFAENVLSPPGEAARVHVHAVSSAYGLLGYSTGWEWLKSRGLFAGGRPPAYLLVQHLGTPDMVLHALTGSFDRSGLPEYRIDEESGLHVQSGDAHFPSVTFDPDETLDATFYTHRPQTAVEMTARIQAQGGTGIVVSLAECLECYPRIRRMVAGAGIGLPPDPRDVLEWSLVMAFTGLFKTVERNLLPDADEFVVHGSGLYSRGDFRPLPQRCIHPAATVDDVAEVVFAPTPPNRRTGLPAS
jgi:hypothetical protein